MPSNALGPAISKGQKRKHECPKCGAKPFQRCKNLSNHVSAITTYCKEMHSER